MLKLILGILLLTFLFNSEGQILREETVNLVDAIYVDIPSNVSFVAEYPVEDFMLAYFSIDSAQFLTAYVGNAPLFPSEQCSGHELTTHKDINGLTSKVVFCSSDELSSEILVDLNVGSGWPRFVHFMLKKSDEPVFSVAQRIVDSMVVRP